MDSENGKLTEGYTIVQSQEAATLFTGYAAFHINVCGFGGFRRKESNLWCRERKKSSLEYFSPRYWGSNHPMETEYIHGLPYVRFLETKFNKYTVRTSPSSGALSVFEFRFWLLKKRGHPQQCLC